jgi:hypothetical protein
MYTVLWTSYVQVMGMAKVLVDHSLGIMLYFSHSCFLFMIMNCIDYNMLCTDCEPNKLDYGCDTMIMGIIDIMDEYVIGHL